MFFGNVYLHMSSVLDIDAGNLNPQNKKKKQVSNCSETTFLINEIKHYK